MTAYDDVPYTGHPYADSHPERLATMATLFGVTPAPVERCRVLEIACGDAANLIRMAYALPGSTFTGFDLAAQPIEVGRRMVTRLGLTNIALAQRDLADFPADGGMFDYIIAHGLYSWVPRNLRDALLGLIGNSLSGNGIAFVSYNVYPGWHVGRMVREMLRYHAGGAADAATRITQARALLDFLVAAHDAADAYGALQPPYQQSPA